MVGATHINRSLRTASSIVASRLVRTMAYQLECQFEEMRSALGIAEAAPVASISRGQIAASSYGRLQQMLSSNSVSFEDVCDRYLNDPTIRRTPKSLGMYRSNFNVFILLIGADTPVGTVSREVCRDLLTVLQKLPPKASMRWPSLAPRELAEKAAEEGMFQYVITTTTEPPTAMRHEPWLVLQLSSAPAERRLFGLDL